MSYAYILRLPEDKKEVLRYLASQKNKSIAQIVREALFEYITKEKEKKEISFNDVLDISAGAWREKDITYLKNMREIWNKKIEKIRE